MTKAFDRYQLENHKTPTKDFTPGNPKMFGFHKKLRGSLQNPVDLK